MSTRPFPRGIRALGLLLAAGIPLLASAPFGALLREGAVVGLPGPGGTEYLAPGQRLGRVCLAFRRPGGPWRQADTAQLRGTPRGDGAMDYVLGEGLVLESGFVPAGDALLWNLRLRNGSAEPVEVGELSVPLPMRTDFSRHGSVSQSVLKHSFVSGHGSFLFWMRPDSRPPFLAMTPTGETSLEYWEAQEGYRVFLHAGARLAGMGAQGTWRLPVTTLKLAPANTPGSDKAYGFKFQWADGYEGMRRLLLEEGKVDVQVVPGMTLPQDLPGLFALRCRESRLRVEAEHPADTQLDLLESRADGTRIYQVRFRRLGENRLTVHYGAGQSLHLEWFSSEPLETLIRKRAAFIASRQVRDSGKWYDGLLAEWNMETAVPLGPDNYDRIRSWRIYEVTCDDPGLSKPAFLASKLALFPDQGEMDAMDRYVERFVWGGLQRTREEAHPFGIYGIPDWKRNRESEDPGTRGRLHIWRVYDYPHLVVMYLGLYRALKANPWLRASRTPEEYLRRAWGTAMALFTVPLQVEGWSAYETGLYNETVIPGLLRELEDQGLRAEALALKGHWERKVDFFVNGQPDLFGSEYPFDSTGFESTYALAAYAMEASRSQDPALRARFPRAAAQGFMERQLAANLFCRGWLEPAYYLLGSDYRGGGGDGFTLSYMSPMGGGSILEQGLRYAADPAPWLRLGYASLLSSWALMNTGTPESNHGYWYPGELNDGAAGGGFEPASRGYTWLGQPHRRGAWYYSCETDLGYCGYLRHAATLLVQDPLFGRICLGGTWKGEPGGEVSVEPRDGVRRRFHALLGAQRLSLLLEEDRFQGALRMATDLSRIAFRLEGDNPAPHGERLTLRGTAGRYRFSGPGGACAEVTLGAGEEARVLLPVPGGRGSDWSLTRLP